MNFVLRYSFYFSSSSNIPSPSQIFAMSKNQNRSGPSKRGPTPRSMAFRSGKVVNAPRNVPRFDSGAFKAPQSGCAWQKYPGSNDLRFSGKYAAKMFYHVLKAVKSPVLLEEDSIYRAVFSISTTCDVRIGVVDTIQLGPGNEVTSLGDFLPEYPTGVIRGGSVDSPKVGGFECVFFSSSDRGIQMQNFKHSVALALGIIRIGDVNPTDTCSINEIWIERKAYRAEGPRRNLVTLKLHDDADDLWDRLSLLNQK